MPRTSRFHLPVRAKPKARPRVTRKGTFMPRDYRDWKTLVAHLLALKNRKGVFEGPVAVDIQIGKDEMLVTVTELPENQTRIDGTLGDIDNLYGAVLDAMQEGGVIRNDKQVIVLSGQIETREK